MTSGSPPKLAYWLLKVFCREEYLNEVAGDMQEIYEWRRTTGTLNAARFRYYLDVFSAIRFYKSTRFNSLISNAMLFSFIKSSFRNFKRHVGYTTLNVLGLAISLSAALFILEYVSEELNFNNSSEAGSLYRVSNDYYRFGGMIYESSMTFSGVGPAMKRELQEVTEFARLFSTTISQGSAVVLTRPDEPKVNFKEEKLFFADAAYPGFFDLAITHGVNQLAKPNTMLLTEELAIKYFGGVENALGNTLQYDDGHGSYLFTITGIFKRPWFQLQIDADALVSYRTLAERNPNVFENDWGGNSFITFVQVTESANPRAIEQEMDALTLRYKPAYAEKNDQGTYQRVNRYFLTGITDIHLNSTLQNEIGPVGDATTIHLLQVIALFIVIIAWINFVNLNTARSVERAREVGVRKVLGAHKNELVMQFFTEAVLINIMAVMLAIGFVVLGQPLFNNFVEKSLSLHEIDLTRFGIWALVCFLIGTTLSAFYPALVISSHQTINALKGKSTGGSGMALRRGLIVFQLLFSSLLIVATLAIDKQLKFMNDFAMGFDMEQVVVLNGPIINAEEEDQHLSAIERFRHQVFTTAGVSSIGTSTVIPGQGILRGMALSRIKEDEANMKSIERVVTSNHFLSTMKVKFLAGTDFNEGMEGYTPIIINVSAANELGFSIPEEAVGHTLYEFTSEERRVVGVIEDYHHESLNRAIDPMYFVRNEAVDSYYAIRLTSQEIGATLDTIEKYYKAAFPGNPVEYYFLDDFFAWQYKKDEVNLRVFTAFAIMAIVVACLGLYGLSSFSTLQRTKEVGVRKVLGASVPGLFLLLSREVFFLVLTGYLMAMPLAWLGIDHWLNAFAYRMSMGGLLFLAPLVLIMVIMLVATGFTVLKVALVNPVQSLSYE